MKESIFKFFLVVLMGLSLTDCGESTTVTCRKRCQDITNVCFLTSVNNPNPAQNQATTCFLYSISCNDNCGYTRSSSSSSSSRRN